MTPNRVAGGCLAPSPHSTPHAGPHGALPPELKGHRQMATSNAGYGSNRQGRFTRSGAIRALRSVRLSRCRRFRPSPCPTHYSGRLATMPSADFCPITSGVAARRADWITVGTGGHSAAFAVVLNPAPMATSVTLGFDGYSIPFEVALSSTSMVTQSASWTDLPE